MGEVIYVVAGNEISAEEVLEVLNGGDDKDFFVLKDGKIIVNL